MSDNPKLIVSGDTKDWLIDHSGNDLDTYIMIVPEWPTMPCPECGGYGFRVDMLVDGQNPTCDACSRDGWVGVAENYLRQGPAVVPIPEGFTVDVGYWAYPDRPEDRWPPEWHHIATATLASVEPHGDKFKVTLDFI